MFLNIIPHNIKRSVCINLKNKFTIISSHFDYKSLILEVLNGRYSFFLECYKSFSKCIKCIISPLTCFFSFKDTILHHFFWTIKVKNKSKGYMGCNLKKLDNLSN